MWTRADARGTTWFRQGDLANLVNEACIILLLVLANVLCRWRSLTNWPKNKIMMRLSDVRIWFFFFFYFFGFFFSGGKGKKKKNPPPQYGTYHEDRPCHSGKLVPEHGPSIQLSIIPRCRATRRVNHVFARAGSLQFHSKRHLESMISRLIRLVVCWGNNSVGQEGGLPVLQMILNVPVSLPS